jgi:hypothetical protein
MNLIVVGQTLGVESIITIRHGMFDVVTTA